MKRNKIFLTVFTVGIFLLSSLSCWAEEPVIIGLQAPITGDYAIEGQMAKQCVEIAAELINQEGGINGRPVEIIIADDGSNPKDSALAAQKLISQKVVACLLYTSRCV